MKLRWTVPASLDLRRLHAFLAPRDPRAAAKVVRTLRAAAKRLEDHPRMGVHLDRFADREVRRLIAGAYEVRYELRGETLLVLRIFHSREDR